MSVNDSHNNICLFWVDNFNKSRFHFEMDVIKFRDNTMPCTTKRTLIYGVIKLNSGIRLEYCRDCVCDLLQILNLWM